MGFLKKIKGATSRKKKKEKKSGFTKKQKAAASSAAAAAAAAGVTSTSAAADSGRTDESRAPSPVHHTSTNGDHTNGHSKPAASAAKAKTKSGARSPHRGMGRHIMNPHHHRGKAASSPQSAASGGSGGGGGAGGVAPSMSLIPGLIEDLEMAPTASGDVPARALRMLFSLSEHGGSSSAAGGGTESNRTVMVREADGKLVPVLLNFLRRCERGSSEQYLALLVLNNVSIPSDNKRIIAMDYGGAHLLSRLLCIDPSCHLMAIVLVNLSFADAELRRELVAPSSPVQLVDALSYTLLMSTLTSEEHESRPPLIDANDHSIKFMGKTGGEEINLSPRKLLAAAMAEDRKYRPALTDLDYNGSEAAAAKDGGTSTGGNTAPAPFDVANVMYAETARWCLCALKNLTRPSKDPLAAHALMDTAIVPLILKFVTVGAGSGEGEAAAAASGGACGATCGGGLDDAIENVDPNSKNDPSTWDANSLQDAALFTLLNMSAISAARPYLRELDAARPLSLIVKSSSQSLCNGPAATDQQKQLAFQCLKARMALAFLLASEGHFGQHRASSETTAYHARTDRSVILTNDSEAELLVELLANALHQRAKEGAGGYSAATFSVKGVLCAIRCLLTSAENQATLATSVGLRLNALLLLALAQHAIRGAPAIDSEAAEHACFSLYLLSNFGFKYPFLPTSFSYTSQPDKVFTSYLHTENVSAAGRHAASQLLLRLRHLIFQGEIEDDVERGIEASDYEFSNEIKRDLESIFVEKRSPGATPRDDIFDRAILRSRAPKKGTEKAPWDNTSSVSPFPNALLAVQQMSYGSTKVRHLGAIDDVLIANNIAKSANGEKAESYNYWWKWQDDVKKYSSRGGGATSTPSTANRSDSEGGIMSSLLSRAGGGGEDTEPISIFGFTCCAADTV